MIAARSGGLLALLALVFVFVFVFLSACALPAPPALPSGAGIPFPAFEAALAQATSACAGIQTLSAAMAISGRAGGTTLRGRIDAGFAAPDRARLEGVAPFGRPLFILVADGGHGTLLLPRDRRVIRDAPPAQIVEAIAGVSLGAAELRAAVSGCGLSTGAVPHDGRTYADGWAAVDLDEGTVYLRRGDAGVWRVAAATRGTIAVYYADDDRGRPATVRIRALDGGQAVADLTLRLSQVDINVPLGPNVFDAAVPDDAEPLTLEALRRAGPLGGTSK